MRHVPRVAPRDQDRLRTVISVGAGESIRKIQSRTPGSNRGTFPAPPASCLYAKFNAPCVVVQAAGATPSLENSEIIWQSRQRRCHRHSPIHPLFFAGSRSHACCGQSLSDARVRDSSTGARAYRRIPERPQASEVSTRRQPEWRTRRPHAPGWRICSTPETGVPPGLPARPNLRPDDGTEEGRRC